jgi:hypothetical protein
MTEAEREEEADIMRQKEEAKLRWRRLLTRLRVRAHRKCLGS